MLTFSRSARSQLDSYSAESLTPSQRARTEITNYHAWFWQKVTQYRTSLGLPLPIELATGTEREADVLAAIELEGVERVNKDKRQVSDYSTALEYNLPNGRPERLTEPRPSNDGVAARLRELHRSTGRIHYDDLAYYAWLLLDGSQTLRHLWRHKYPVIAVKRANENLAKQKLSPLPDGITPHSLRRTFASVLYALGEDPGIVMDEMGHTHPALALRVYRQSMRRGEDEKAQLRALIEGSELADIVRRTAETPSAATERYAA